MWRSSSCEPLRLWWHGGCCGGQAHARGRDAAAAARPQCLDSYSVATGAWRPSRHTPASPRCGGRSALPALGSPAAGSYSTCVSAWPRCWRSLLRRPPPLRRLRPPDPGRRVVRRLLRPDLHLPGHVHFLHRELWQGESFVPSSDMCWGCTYTCPAMHASEELLRCCFWAAWHMLARCAVLCLLRPGLCSPLVCGQLCWGPHPIRLGAPRPAGGAPAGPLSLGRVVGPAPPPGPRGHQAHSGRHRCHQRLN